MSWDTKTRSHVCDKCGGPVKIGVEDPGKYFYAAFEGRGNDLPDELEPGLLPFANDRLHFCRTCALGAIRALLAWCKS